MNNFKKNAEALQRQSEKFTAWLDEQRPVDWTYRIKADNGDYNAVLKHGIVTETIYDNKAPRKKARELTKNWHCYRDEVTIVIGAGVGHITKLLCDKMEKGHTVIVVEPVADFIKMSLETYNFSKWIEKGQLLFAVTRDDFWVCCNALMNNYVIQNWSLIIDEYTTKRPGEYHDLTQFVINHIGQVQCNMGTVMGAGKKIATNDIETLPYIIKHRGVKDLKDIYKGCPAVTIGTGPSLQNNIHLLREHQDKVIIIAVAQALRILLAYGIRPDFICTVDYGDVNMGHFKGLMDSDVPLVALNRTYAPILQEYQGPMFISGTPMPGFEESGLGIISRKGHLEQGGSVAHMCLGLAIHLGCSQIALMGHDLSLGKTSHFKAADESGDIFVDSKGMIQWKVTDPKSHLYGKTYSMGPAVWTDGYFGGKVLTNQGLKSFITNFERIIEFQSSDIDFFNTTEGGARVKGAKNISLKKYLEEKAKEEIKKEKALQPYLSPEPKYEKQIKDTIPKLERDILQLKELKLNSEKAIKLLDEIEKAKADKLPELLNEQQKYSTKAEDLAKMNPLVQVYIYNESVQIHSRQLKVKGAPEHLIEDEKDLKTRVKRSRLILVAAKEAAEIFEASYEESLNILKQFIKSKDKSILSRPPEEYCPSLEKADEMLENNSFARVLLDADKILRENPDDEKAIECYKKACQLRDELIKEAESCEDNQPWVDYLHLIEEAQKKGRDEKDFDVALDMLKQAMELKPDKPEAIWGYATTCAHLNRNEESEKYFKQLTEKWPDNLQFAFEHALVILRIDPVEGLKAMGDVMSKTDAYDSFLISVGDLYMSSKLPEQAVNAYEQYVKKFPADAKGWEKFGLCLQTIGDDTEANMAFRRAKRLSISESPVN